VTRLEIVLLLVAFGTVVFILELVRRRQLREKYALLWLLVGTSGMLLTIFRSALDRISLFLGIAYPPAALFLFATVFLMGVVAHLSWEVSRLEDRTRRLAEEVALLRPMRRDPDAAKAPAESPGGG
jgi:hypothetical protein